MKRMLSEARSQTNFGGNQTWQSRWYQPRDEQDVLDVLERHSDGQVRPLGSKHSWSEIGFSADINLDMSQFKQVRLFTEDGEQFVRVGAGCQLHEILDRLHAGSERTLPTLAAITRQTISGAISTGTHGSGKQSLSHFIAAARVAAFDMATGKPKIFEFRDGDELRAARCALGCMGVILSVDIRTVPKYLVEETVARPETLEEILSQYRDYPLTQFILVPFAWRYVAWQRREAEMRNRSAGERFKAGLFRTYQTLWVDLLLHVSLKLSLVVGRPVAKFLLKMMAQAFVTGIVRHDRAECVLTLGHHYFRHEEMEFFIAESHVRDAVDVLRCATEVFAGEATSIAPDLARRLRALDLYEALVQSSGTYVQHYPFFFRRLLPEDTLISMASSTAEPVYSISVFTYYPPELRGEYYAFCSWIARCMSGLFGARLHWGKHFPVGAESIARGYPKLDAFKQLCRSLDPNGVFRNDYTKRVIGF
jgi:hypothetical protein